MNKVDICIIGAGSGGLSVAAGAAQLGMNVVLIERSKMGGDCLNTGCVPSKALLAAAKRAQAHRKTDVNGIAAHEPEIDFSAIKDYVFDTIKTIEPNDSVVRFEGMGVKVIHQNAKFLSPKSVQAGDEIITARYFIIATGSHAVVPPITGLDKDKCFTNENIFDLRERPNHLLIIGGGPIGLEMAQAHHRLGCRVSVFDMGDILPRDDVDNVSILRQSLVSEGIELFEQIKITKITHEGKNHTIQIEQNGQTIDITGTHILVAAGRAPNTEGLDLERANIAYDKKGITVNASLKTSNKNIFAIGDVSGGPQFTHVAGYHAGIIIRNICFKIPAKVDYKALPWVTYTDPELAQVGLTAKSAIEKFGEGNIRIVSWDFADNDRAVAERATNGHIKIITDKKGYIFGASIVGAHAGELISMWALAISSGLKIGAVASMIVPYPTISEVGKRAAGAWYTPQLFSEKTKKIVKLLQKLPF